MTTDTLTILDRTFHVMRVTGAPDPMRTLTYQHVTNTQIVITLRKLGPAWHSGVSAGHIYSGSAGPTPELALQNGMDAYNQAFNDQRAFGTL